MRATYRLALLSCAAVLGGCAAQQSGPEYRLSASTAAVVPGASMLQRGRAQLDAGLDALAIESFRAEIRLNPQSADGFNGLAVAYGRIGRNDLAQRYLETALAKDPSNRKAQANLARLTGDEAPTEQLAIIAAPELPAIEPVAVASLDISAPITPIASGIEMSVPRPLAAAEQVVQVAPVKYALARHGILSTRLAVAPARMAKIAPAPSKPIEPPAQPRPPIPTGNLPVDYRGSSTRLVRMSLGEVHLITRPQTVFKTAHRTPEFKSFGDRLAVWLPNSIASENASAVSTVDDDAVLLAAIDRAVEKLKVARAQRATLPKMPEFAYLSIDSGRDFPEV